MVGVSQSPKAAPNPLRHSKSGFSFSIAAM
jgi:hypothetical protein